MKSCSSKLVHDRLLILKKTNNSPETRNQKYRLYQKTTIQPKSIFYALPFLLRIYFPTKIAWPYKIWIQKVQKRSETVRVYIYIGTPLQNWWTCHWHLFSVLPGVYLRRIKYVIKIHKKIFRQVKKNILINSQTVVLLSCCLSTVAPEITKIRCFRACSTHIYYSFIWRPRSRNHKILVV